MTANPFTAVFGNDAEAARRASPVGHVCAGLPPFLIVHADEDLPTLAEMAGKFHAALRASKCEAQLLKVPQRNHGTVLWKATRPDDPLVRAALGFVRQHVAQPR